MIPFSMRLSTPFTGIFSEKFFSINIGILYIFLSLRGLDIFNERYIISTVNKFYFLIRRNYTEESLTCLSYFF